MESQVEMFKAMMGDVNFNPSTNEFKVEPFYCLEIEREHLVQQTLLKIKEANPKDVRKRLRVSFKGEDGLDAGGVTKEVSALIDLFRRLTVLCELISLHHRFSFFNSLAKSYLMFTPDSGRRNMATASIGSTPIIHGTRMHTNSLACCLAWQCIIQCY
jgi:hypothetical protein